MAKIDLLLSEDFGAYQDDLKKLLHAEYAKLHSMIAAANPSIEHQMRLYAQQAVIAEIEIILHYPVNYLPKAKPEDKALRESFARNCAASNLDTMMRAFDAAKGGETSDS